MSQRRKKKNLVSDESDDEFVDHDRPRMSQTISRKKTRKGSGSQRSKGKREREDDVEPTAIKKKRVSKGKAFDKLTENEVESLVGNVMRFMLFKESKKIPIRKAEISKVVFSKYKNVSGDIFKIVKEKMRTLLGFELVPTTKKSDSWILRSLLSERLKDVNGVASITTEEKKMKVILMAILSFIWMGNNKLDKEKLISYLRSSGLTSGDKIPYETLLCRQLYLEKKRVATGNNEYTNEYSYGIRSLLEIGKMKIAEHVAFMSGEKLDVVIRAELEREQQKIDQEEEKRKTALIEARSSQNPPGNPKNTTSLLN